MKIARNNLFIGAYLLFALVLFTGCKSGTASAPVKEPVPAPVVKEEAKTPTPPVVNPANPSDAQGLLKQAAGNSLSAKSVSSEILITVDAMGMSYPVTLDITKYDNLTYISSEIMNRPVEGFLDAKTLVMLDPMSRKWMRMQPEEKDMILSLFEQVYRKIYIEHINSASFNNEEKIQDKNYQVIEAIIKPEAANEILATQNNPLMQGLSVKIDKSSLKVWVEKDTCLIYKSILNMEATLSGDIPGMSGNDIEDEDETESKSPSSKPDEKKPEESKMTKIKYEIEINNSDYNKVEPIVIPDEVKKLLEAPMAIEPTTK